jgi:GAF domain-containing protein
MDKAELKTLCREVLCEGIQRFPVLVGIVSRISGNDYEIFSVVSDTGVIKESDVYQLDCVYCRDVYKTKNTIAITEIDGFPIEVYISSPIIVNDKVWGTLNFSSLDITNTSFSKDDIQFNEEQAKKIATAISNIN